MNRSRAINHEPEFILPLQQMEFFWKNSLGIVDPYVFFFLNNFFFNFSLSKFVFILEIFYLLIII